MTPKKSERAFSQTAVIVILLVIIAGVVIGYSLSRRAENETSTNEEKTMMEKDTMEKKEDSMMEDKKDGDSMMQEGKEMMKDEGMMMEKTEVKTFNLAGRNFVFSTSEIRVKKDDKVIVNFESTEGFHDWTVEGYGVGTKSVMPGTKTSVEFVADKTGVFEYYCSVGNHRQQGMIGKLIVE